MSRLDEQCRFVFDDTDFYQGGLYYANQLYGLLIKTLRVRYRRWAVTMIVLLLPIIYNLLSNIISRSQNANGIFRMQANALNPQTVLYRADPLMVRFFQAAVAPKPKDVVLERRTENISDMNHHIWREWISFYQRSSSLFFSGRETQGSSVHVHGHLSRVSSSCTGRRHVQDASPLVQSDLGLRSVLGCLGHIL